MIRSEIILHILIILHFITTKLINLLVVFDLKFGRFIPLFFFNTIHKLDRTRDLIINYIVLYASYVKYQTQGVINKYQGKKPNTRAIKY